MARPNLDQWREKLKEFDDIVKYRETTWFNPQVHDKYQASAPVTFQDIEDAAQRLDRFRPLLQKLFPDLTQSGGMIESPLIEIPAMQKMLAEQVQCQPSGRLFLKADNLLPVAGSIKARGGIYEVLQLAEKIALKNNILTISSDYSVLSEKPAREIFNRHRIRVGSTGNLGLSIGIMGTRLGFQVTVHMSTDARQWKKELLRSHGAEVVEHSGDYETAVREGRNLASNDPC
jgi:D-serine dehydratase